jgi:hypothetical protein
MTSDTSIYREVSVSYTASVRGQDHSYKTPDIYD